jgi:hypothetical protein
VIEPTEWVLSYVNTALTTSLTTDQIAEDLGIRYSSLLKRLGHHDLELKRRMMLRRDEEWQARKPFIVFPDPASKPRCRHGYWSTDTDCHHDVAERQHV